MKKIMALICIIAILFVASASYADTPIKKLGRGFANIITSPLAVIDGVGNINQENGPLAAMTTGLLQGICNMCARVVVGAYEIVTFPIPLPGGYGPILTEPEYFLEDGLF